MQFLIDNWQIITGAIGAVVAFFGGKKLAKSKEQQEQGTALDLMQKSYKSFVEDYEKKFLEMRTEIEKLKGFERENLEKIGTLKGQLAEMSAGRARDKKLITDLTAKVAHYEYKLQELSKKNN